jgi:hypothetical protein
MPYNQQIVSANVCRIGRRDDGWTRVEDVDDYHPNLLDACERAMEFR